MMKLVAVLLAGTALVAGCSGQNGRSQFAPALPGQSGGIPSQSRSVPTNAGVVSSEMPQVTVTNGWTSETQVIEWSTGCTFPFSPHQFSLLPGQSQQMVADNLTCLLNTATKTFVDADPFAQSQGCVLGIRFVRNGHWRFSLVRRLTGQFSRCKLETSSNQATLIFNAVSS
jgi:hypothetical protein